MKNLKFVISHTVVTSCGGDTRQDFSKRQFCTEFGNEWRVFAIPLQAASLMQAVHGKRPGKRLNAIAQAGKHHPLLGLTAAWSFVPAAHGTFTTLASGA